jgi:hypothetical protein
MSSARPQFVRIGLKHRATGVRLRLRWDRSPRSCAALVANLPIEGTAFHGKYANHEIYTLVPMFPEGDPGAEWKCIYPGPGDMMLIPVYPGVILPPGAPPMDPEQGVLDLAFWYERGNNRTGPGGPGLGNIVATGVTFDEIERFAVSCTDMWANGFAHERIVIEPTD